jgi:hypothetical protein
MSVNRATLELQELCDRALPSPVVLYPTDPVGPVAVVQHAHPLHGTGAGTYQGPAVAVDTGTSLTLRGSADLGALGKFQFTGRVQGVGMIAWGRAAGELVLTNGHGSITLALHGPTQQAFGALPHEMVYTVSGGTSDYSHLSGYGTVGLHLTPAPVAVGHAPAGAVALSFS